MHIKGHLVSILGDDCQDTYTKDIEVYNIDENIWKTLSGVLQSTNYFRPHVLPYTNDIGILVKSNGVLIKFDFSKEIVLPDVADIGCKQSLVNTQYSILLPVIYATRCVFFNATRCNLLNNFTRVMDALYLKTTRKVLHR